MLWEAAFWRDVPGRIRQATDLDEPKLAVWIADWMNSGDTGVIAQSAAGPIGAAWYRFWSEDKHSYGFVSPQVPELAIAVVPGARGKGVGARLLAELLRSAEDKELAAISLSVEVDNPARQLYERLGFLRTKEVQGAWTMVRAFPRSLLGFEE